MATEKTLQDRQLEDMLVLFLEAKDWPSAVAISAALAQRLADDPNGWFGIGSALWRMAFTQPTLLEPAITALKKAEALNDDPDNKRYKQLLFTAQHDAEKAKLDFEAIRPYAGDPLAFLPMAGFDPVQMVTTARGFDWEQRAKLITYTAELDTPWALTLLQDIAANDPNMNVRRTAERALAARPKPAAQTPTPSADMTEEEIATTPPPAASPAIPPTPDTEPPASEG